MRGGAGDFPFARVVRDRIRERGVGLRELCRAVRLDPSFLSKVLSGKRSPPSEESVLRRIATALEMDPTVLVVAAGRIPREWRSLCHDAALLAEVHRLTASGSGGGELPPVHLRSPEARPLRSLAARSLRARSRATAVLPSSFGEELL